MSTAGMLPFALKLTANFAPVAANTDASTVVAIVPRDGQVTACAAVFAGAIDGDDTNTRTFQLVNKGQDGSGTTVIAELLLPNANNAVAFDAEPFTIDTDPAATNDVAAGDVLALVETTPGTGVANPGGLLLVTVGNSADAA